ncbi:MAG: cytochrome c [Bryobacteraceae bacterium]
MPKTCAAIAVLAFAAGACAARPDPKKGREVFSAQCAVCHNADNTEKKTGPGLKGLYKRAKLVNGQMVTDATVRAKIDQGGSGMPAYRDLLADDEKSALLAYLKTL